MSRNTLFQKFNSRYFYTSGSLTSLYIDHICAVVLSRDNHYIICGLSSGAVKIIDIQAKRPIYSYYNPDFRTPFYTLSL